MLVMSLHYFKPELTGILKNKEIATNWIYRSSFSIHIALGIIAMFIGPLQFINRVRTKYLQLHRKVGYLYFFCVVISAIAGLGVAQYAMGGIISTLGFSLLAIFWFSSVIMAIKYIREGNITKHKKWMYISYGLTFAAIPQRTLLIFPLFLDIEFIPIYRLSAWLPWILDTLIAVYLFKKSEMKIANQLT